MSQKTAKTWSLRLLPFLLSFISFVMYYCSYSILQSYGGTSKSPNSSKALCGGWLTQKKWESLNFNSSRQTQLFLRLKDFFWKEHRSKLPLPYGVKGSEFLLLKVLAITANYQMPANLENLECRTCVVIGNGFVIKNSSLGDIINKYDVVIRLNDAPVKGYEEDVGNKTTMRFFYPESASYNPGLQNEPDTLMVLVPFKMHDLRWLKEILYNEKRVRKGFWKPPPQIWLGDVNKIRVLDPHFLHQTADKLLHLLPPKGKQNPVHPTTGLLSIFVALNYCDVVHVAGFGYPSSKNHRQPIHYYGRETMKSMKNSYHDLNHEAKALKRLEESGAILYLHPHL
ncbi:CMP-N-acetylneuraminate-beta-galactosamide-alpha-2,3-sialyltransferase 4 [Nothobranchius furzeri]|uniref:CMP-N-acetylneuraminate-beta-galactosamide-alpha-2,3-sialyltransferase 4 n=1 Tax=Nothobranchius furzeri TaxID=105023 RepID=A0A1A7ZK64_NOTFU|nr:CMP-N-acetylneuraminate-beta-galactosamide-alpha-2,3-sialyltransferase 4 [Nothobranchius furzeri]